MGIFGSQQHRIDPTRLPIFVHAIQSADAFNLCQKVWETNARNLLADQANGKEFLRFVFNNPSCVVWMQRDAGRSDTFELILMWEGKEELTEVYVIAALAGMQIGDDTRAKGLLTSILGMPAVVPVTPNTTPNGQ